MKKEILNKNLNKIYSLEDQLEWYKKYKRFGFIFLKTYKYDESNELDNYLSEHKKRYKYIAKNLNSKESLVFHYRFIDRLESLKSFQDLSLYKYLVGEFIKEIESISKNKKPKLNAPIIKRFCELINDSEISCIGELSREKYCKKVCYKYNLKYTDNVRKHFQHNNKPKESDKYLKNVVELILPKIDVSSRDTIMKYINNHTPIFN